MEPGRHAMMRDANETRKARWLRPVPLAIGLLAAVLLPATTVVGQAQARAVTPVFRRAGPPSTCRA